MAKLSSTDIYGDLTVDGTIRGTVNGSITGNAATTTALQTARTINGTSFNGTANITTANWGTARTLTIGNTGKSVNGSGNVSWSLSEIGAAPTSHNHTSLTGVTKISFATGSSDSANLETVVSDDTTYFDFNLTDDANTDMWRWRFGAWDSSTSSTKIFNAMTLAATSTTAAKLIISGTVQASTFSGALSGNATTATTLQTARTINGTSFNGSANITTANWGTARTLTIGKKGNSVNGSGNVSWSLSDIMGRATTATTSSTNKNKYTKFARVDVSSGAYTNCIGTFDFVPQEAQTVQGSLSYYIRTNSAITSTTISLIWTKINNIEYAKSIVAVKVSDGVYDLYYKPLYDWDTMTITNINCTNPDKITMYSNQSYVDSVTAAATSSLVSHSATSAKLTTARTLTIGNTGKTFDGSANVSWTLSEIGAAASSHTHSYLPLSGGTMTGRIITPNNAQGITIGDDATLCDRNIADHIVIEGSTATNGGITFGSGKDTNIYRGGANILKTDDTMNAVGGFQWNGQSLDSRYAASGHTHNHLEIKGTNTITSTTNDTTANWGAQKSSIHWYTTTGQLTDQPSQYGYLLNIGKDSEVHQLWMTQSSGDLRHRGGNSSGWNGTWKTLLDTSNFKTHVTPSAIGAAASSHTHSYLPLSGGTMTGDLKFTDVTSTTYPAVSKKITWNGSTDGVDLYYQVDASDKGRLMLNTRDDSDCVIAFANQGTIKSTIDNSGNFSGNAASASGFKFWSGTQAQYDALSSKDSKTVYMITG